MVETQLCKLRDTSIAAVLREIWAIVHPFRLLEQAENIKVNKFQDLRRRSGYYCLLVDCTATFFA